MRSLRKCAVLAVLAGLVPLLLTACQSVGEPGAGLAGQTWRLYGIERAGSGNEPVAAEPRYTLEFLDDGRLAGQAHCNRFLGRYETAGANRLRIETGAVTRAACPPPSLEDEYLRALARAETYEMRYDELLLATAERGTLRFVREPPVVVGGPWADAERRGMTFRGLGNEPYWTLEIGAERMAMITELGERRTELPFEEPVVQGARTTWRAAGGGAIVAVVERRPCTDTMSDEQFEAAVTVIFEGRTWRGCGRYL